MGTRMLPWAIVVALVGLMLIAAGEPTTMRASKIVIPGDTLTFEAENGQPLAMLQSRSGVPRFWIYNKEGRPAVTSGAKTTGAGYLRIHHEWPIVNPPDYEGRAHSVGIDGRGLYLAGRPTALGGWGSYANLYRFAGKTTLVLRDEKTKAKILLELAEGTPRIQMFDGEGNVVYSAP